MRRYIWLSLLVLGASFVRGASPDDVDESLLVYPVAPTELLSLLPVAPENWKLTGSKAEKWLSYANYPESYAVRDYLYVPPPPLPGQPVPPPEPPKTVKIILMDTGNNPDRFAMFNGFKVAKDPAEANGGKYLSMETEGLQTIQYQKDPIFLYNIAISSRFLLTIRMNNMKETDAKQWMKIAPLMKMVDASNQAPKVRLASGMLDLEIIDEMNAALSSKSQINFMVKADADRRQMAH